MSDYLYKAQSTVDQITAVCNRAIDAGGGYGIATANSQALAQLSIAYALMGILENLQSKSLDFDSYDDSTAPQ